MPSKATIRHWIVDCWILLIVGPLGELMEHIWKLFGTYLENIWKIFKNSLKHIFKLF